MPLPNKIKQAARKVAAKRAVPLWAGPCGEGPQGGVTQGLVGRWLSCRERFRLLVMEGWKAADHFTPALEFGNLWHVCEETLAASKLSQQTINNIKAGGFKVTEGWQISLTQHAQRLLNKYPFQREQVEHWYRLTQLLFPEYVRHWAAHPDVQVRKPLLQEHAFDVPYPLPSGRVVRLRGKFDSVDLVGRSVILQENKTKSGIDREKIERQLRFDLQTMTYMSALYESDVCPPKTALGGVRYNVVRRPAHKTPESAMKKFAEDRDAGRIGEWFARWNVEVSRPDVERFQRECLDPILENMCDDYEWMTFCTFPKVGQVIAGGVFGGGTRQNIFPHHCPRHFRYPFGCHNVLAEGGFSDLDAMIDNGSTAGLRQCDNLFPELQEVGQ